MWLKIVTSGLWPFFVKALMRVSVKIRELSDNDKAQLPDSLANPFWMMSMLKRIAVADLRIGMYIQEFCGSWMDHPFWKSKFMLSSEKDLARIHSSAITELWIDVGKGLM